MNVFLFLMTSILMRICCCSKSLKTKELLDVLKCNYTTKLRPGLDQDDPLIVNVTMNLVALTKLDEVEGYISTVEFFDITWVDERISWNTSAFEGIASLTFRSDQIWTPDMVIANPADKMYNFDENPSLVRYNSDGLALWRQGLVTKTLCNIETPAYPFDVHACYISVLLWGTLPSEITFSSPLNHVKTYFYGGNSEWSLTGSRAVAFNVQELSTITFGFKFSRISTFLTINVVMPIVFFSVLNSVVFLLPYESGERVTFSVTMLLSFVVFLNVVEANVPKTSSPMPQMCHYVVIVLVTSGVITLLDTLCQRVYHTRGLEPVPKWLQIALCMPSICVKDKGASSPARDGNIVPGMMRSGEEDCAVIWKDAILRIDTILFTFFLMFAAAVAIGFLYSMMNMKTKDWDIV